jgi:CubicO group peptidase (beta-lactamase class C family)
MRCLNLVLLTSVIGALIACGGGGGSAPAVQTPVTPTPSAEPDQSAFDWSEADPESEGMNSDQLEFAFDMAFAEGSFTQAALVIRNKRIVYERYRGILDAERQSISASTFLSDASVTDSYGNRDRDSLVSSWSTAKSFTSIVIGIAIGQDYIQSLDESAANYINEWANDGRATISIRQLLDMRSGLVPVCFDPASKNLAECTETDGSGGNLVYAEDQMSACIQRSLAPETGSPVWYLNGLVPYNRGAWLYSNCDSMILGEIIFRATGQSLQTYADVHLFSKLGMTAYWWRDNAAIGQENGNFLAYCCLDATARDFARFGQLILDGGIWEGEQIIPSGYIDALKNITQDSVVGPPYDSNFSYGLKFWTITPRQQDDGSLFPDEFTLFSTIGFDGQYIVIDFENDLIVVRNSLYNQSVNQGSELKMTVDSLDESQSNFTATLPNGIGASLPSSFNVQKFLHQIYQSINAP